MNLVGLKSEDRRCESVLVVEDNQDIREAVVEEIASEGYAVSSAANGQEAVEKLRTVTTPVLILLDLMMPTMTGWQFLEAQRLDPNLSQHEIILMSAVNPDFGPGNNVNVRNKKRLPKPISLPRLWALVYQYCTEPKAAQKSL